MTEVAENMIKRDGEYVTINAPMPLSVSRRMAIALAERILSLCDVPDIGEVDLLTEGDGSMATAEMHLTMAQAYGAWNGLMKALETLQQGGYAQDAMLATMVAQMTPLGPWLRFQMSKMEASK